MSENKMLRRIFGPKMEKETEWRKLHNKELKICTFHHLLLKVKLE
jgi:hypothetical protein